ncbi:hypothetical protein SASPL_144368 [Salvia splendens]|uniref:Uncharacterized protein n=1 Tax=Salvia splendens TaxID=180675 RepID=A0A8X8WEP8_SALSN|nr:hypothetical protein SASPL_144368 [Salvia splendens]
MGKSMINFKFHQNFNKMILNLIDFSLYLSIYSQCCIQKSVSSVTCLLISTLYQKFFPSSIFFTIRIVLCRTESKIPATCKKSNEFRLR